MLPTLIVLESIAELRREIFGPVLHGLLAASAKLAERDGVIVGLRCFAADGEAPREALVFERAVSTNRAAAAGNASLMTIA